MSKNIEAENLYNPKIFKVLSTFSAEEFKKFGEFVGSKYFNRNKKAGSLFHAIKKYYPLFTSIELTKEKLSKKLLGSKPNDSTMRNLFSALLGLAEEFIATENFRNNKGTRIDYLIQGLMQKNLFSLSKTALAKQEAELASGTKISTGFFLNKYYHETNKFNFSVLNEKVVKLKHVFRQIEKLKNSEAYITLHFVMEIISDHINLFLYSEKFDINDIPGISEKLLNDFELHVIYKKLKRKTEYSFILLLYIKLLKTFSKPNNRACYTDYKNTVMKLQSRLSNDEFSFHYSRLVSYMTLKVSQNQRNAEFRRELFSLLVTMVERGYYKDDKTNYIPPTLYRIIVMVAIEHKELQWLEKLIGRSDQLLAPKHETNMINYARTLYNYEIGNFIEALNITHSILLDNFIYKYDIYNLKLKTYYDTGDFNTLLDQIHTYLLYIKNDKLLPGKKKINHRLFAKYLKLLTLYRSGKNNIDIEFHLHKLSSLTNISNQNWLEGKYREILQISPAKKAV